MKAAVSGDIQGKFQAAPDAKLVKGIAQVVFNDLLGGADHIADFAIGLAFPNQRSDLNFLSG
jgi:hypothetical protein